MNQCAIVIPLYPIKYNYGYSVFNELLGTDADIYFVFTNNHEKELFASKIDNNNIQYFNFIILSDYVNIDEVIKKNSYVSVKNLVSLSLLYKKYDYISCIGSEIMFLNKTNFYQMMENIVNNKTVCGGLLHTNVCERTIVMDSLKLIDETYYEKIKEISSDFRIYTYWCNLPVYNCKLAEEFLNWIHFDANRLETFSWNIFDDITYTYFCVLFYDYQIKVIDNWYYDIEYCDTEIVENTNNHLCKLYWVNKNAYTQNKSYYENNDFKIVYHIDKW